jgi:serine/threonine protein kinase
MFRIGVGGFGTVYKALHREQEKIVALKIFCLEESFTEEFAQRYRREVQLLKKMRHPSIISLQEADTFEYEGTRYWYLALEYFQGVNLFDYINGRKSSLSLDPRMPWQKVCSLTYQICQGLLYMHQQNVIHRDLKPQNILYEEVKGISKIIDLGLGKCIQEKDYRETLFTTQANCSLGTPDFMPIEQWYDFKEVDHRGDIYSLGATLYFLLSAQYPYGSQPSLTSLYNAIVQQQRLPLEGNCSPETPQELITLVNKMMAFHAKDRYSSCKEVLESLQKMAQTYKMTLP